MFYIKKNKKNAEKQYVPVMYIIFYSVSLIIKKRTLLLFSAANMSLVIKSELVQCLFI